MTSIVDVLQGEETRRQKHISKLTEPDSNTEYDMCARDFLQI